MPRMEAEICFSNLDVMNAANAALIENNFNVVVLDWVDPESAAVWVVARADSELDQNHFLDWVSTVIDPFHGFVVEAGLVNQPAAA